VRLEPVKQMRKDVDLWPMIAEAKTPAELRVNATLTRLNARLGRSVRECDAGYRAALKDMGALAKDQAPVEQDWTRTLEVTMRGPRYLSMVVTDSADCGGAHPNSGQMALVFDMTTGTPVNWLALMPKAVGAKAFSDTVMDGSTAGAVILPALQKMYVAAADPECKDAFDDQVPMMLWPDAAKGTLVAVAFDMSHAVEACADPMDVSMADARRLGFDEEFLREIEAAHAQTVPQLKH
jgi:hypothetical protein